MNFSSSDLSDLKSLRITPLDDDDEDDEDIIIDAEEDDDGGDGDDDDEEEEDVLLGFAEKPSDPASLHRHLFPSKAGGVPAWLDPVNLPPQASRTCGICGDPLQFLLQVYAPVSDKDCAFHRTLFVFMCPSMACLLRDQHEQWKRCPGENPMRSVKVFRCQLPRSNPFYSIEPPRRDGTDRPSSSGAALCSWCGTWKGDKVCSSCRRARYCSEKHQVMHWRLGHKSECHLNISSSEAPVSSHGNDREKLQAVNKVVCNTLWSEYEIVIEDETVFDSEMTEDNSPATSIVSKQDKQDEVFHSLSDKFEADEEKKNWASFQERISKAPEQVLRYRRDPLAKPLWPLLTGRPSKADIPKCNYCKGPRCYEFQIMPQLLYYFGVKNDMDSLDWGAIAVYTCLDSCESNVSYKEEFVWVQLYPPATNNLMAL